MCNSFGSEERIPKVRCCPKKKQTFIIIEIPFRLCVGMKIEAITNEAIRLKLQNSKIQLGAVADKDIPKLFDFTELALDRKMAYWEVLEQSKGFANPSNVDVLCEELGLSKTTGNASLFPSLQFKSAYDNFKIHRINFVAISIFCRYDESRKAPALRKAQTAKVAFKHVAEGIKHYKSGNTMEAFSCLNTVTLTTNLLSGILILDFDHVVTIF